MNTVELLDLVNRGESSLIQFKREITPKQSGDIAAEMVAMSNFEGGLIIIGVEDKTGDIIGLNFKAIEAVILGAGINLIFGNPRLQRRAIHIQQLKGLSVLIFL